MMQGIVIINCMRLSEIAALYKSVAWENLHKQKINKSVLEFGTVCV
jgi:hypothetical protein